MELTEIFRCPNCRGELRLEQEKLVSPDCGKSFPLKDGIPCFVGEDCFYEGKFSVPIEDGLGRSSGAARAAKSVYNKVSITNVKHEFTRSFLGRLEPEVLILDVGCGGGNELLAPYRTVGIDLSFTGLKTASGIYQAVAAADALALPFADGSFDAISSWDFFGHVPFADKEQVLLEWKRVLKPGGLMLHIIEGHCTAPFYKLVKKNPALFKQYFIELDGHVGLEVPSSIVDRFRGAGFEVVKNWSFFRGGIFPPEEYEKRLGPEYRSGSRLMKALAAYGAACERSRQLDRAATFATGLLARAVNPLLPRDWGSTLLLIVKG